jgi:hypothetical protein
MYLTNGDFDLAIASLQQANTIEPWNELAQQMLARALQSRPTLTHFDAIPSGAKGVIRGLVKFAIHNGKHATIQGFDRDKGRYNLLSEDGKGLNVKPQNLLQLIRHCVITGMKSTGRSFNGRQGDIQAWDEVKGGYIMRFGTACGCFIPGACVQFEVRLVHTCILPDHSFFLHFSPLRSAPSKRHDSKRNTSLRVWLGRGSGAQRQMGQHPGYRRSKWPTCRADKPVTVHQD